MDGDDELDNASLHITRERLASGELLAEARRRAPPGTRFLSDTEITASLDQALAHHDPTQDVWLFAYGSLIWNPAIEFAEQRPLLVRGWHRRFCLTLMMGRGAPDCPGLMLALDRGGACRGVGFRLPATHARNELTLVWRREMFTGAYQARWVAASDGNHPIRALTFVANRDHPRYAGALPQTVIVQRIATASGHLGTSRSYLDNTVLSLRRLGIADPTLERLHREVAKHTA
jgi:glutathione-specific gamma-glutamylcyclotransferase